jgi:hypothetical protein
LLIEPQTRRDEAWQSILVRSEHKRGRVKSEIKVLVAQRGGRSGCKSGNHLLVARGISGDRIYLKPTLKLFWP